MSGGVDGSSVNLIQSLPKIWLATVVHSRVLPYPGAPMNTTFSPCFFRYWAQLRISLSFVWAEKAFGSAIGDALFARTVLHEAPPTGGVR